MADNPQTDSQGRYVSLVFALDDISGVFWPYSKLAWGGNNVANPVDASNPLPVTIVGGATAALQTSILGAVDGIEGLLGTMDADTSALAAIISGGKLLVDSELTTQDYDTGGPTVNQATVGLVYPAAGGPVAAPGDATLGLFVQVKQMPGASKETDNVTVFPGVGFLMDGVVPCAIKRFKANVAASTTDATLVAAVTSKKLLIRSVSISNQGATATDATLNTKPGGAGTAISEKITSNGYGGREKAPDDKGHYETAAGEGLTVTTGAGSTQGFAGTYIERA